MEEFATKSIENWLNQLKEVQTRYRSNQITQEEYDAYVSLIESRLRDWLYTLKQMNQPTKPRGEGLWRVPFLL